MGGTRVLRGAKGRMDKRRSEEGQGGEGVTVGDGGDENA